MDETDINDIGTFTLNYDPGPAKLKVKIISNSGVGSVSAHQATLGWLTYEQKYVTTTLCDVENDKYRYGFNGKLKDNEWAGIGNNYDYGARKLDTRTGRFISVDPLNKKFPSLTPYQFASLTPIWAKDLDGKEAWYSNNTGDFLYGPFSSKYIQQNNLSSASFMDNGAKLKFSSCCRLWCCIIVVCVGKQCVPAISTIRDKITSII